MSQKVCKTQKYLWHFAIQNNQKIILILLFLMLCIVGGCSGKKQTKPNTVMLRMVVWGTAADEKAWNEKLKTFYKKHPNIRVRLEFTPWERTFDKLLISTAGGNPPDASIISSVWFVPCAAKGLLEDLGPYVANDKEFDLEDFYPAAINGWGQYNGKLYAIPAGIDIYAMYYNKTMFDKYGVPYPDETWDWKKYVWAAKKLTKDLDGDGRIDQWGTTQNMWQTYVWQNGGDIIDKRGKKCLLDTPEAIEALQFMADLRDKYHVAPMPTDIADIGTKNLFTNGRVGMYFSGSWAVPLYFEKEIKNFEYDVAPVPKGKRRATFFGGASYAILRGSKHKKEAWELVKFMVRKEALRERAIKEQVVPSRISVAESNAFLHLPGPPKHRKVFLDAIAYGHTLPSLPSSREMNYIIDNELYWVISGKKDPRKVCPELAKKINDFLKYEEPVQTREFKLIRRQSDTR
ncbi:MAG: sugar ABC transporter substrate-binding protein [Armatimonadetes bacterium]|nr:sugar ABC transporter substrate-binding protein [Armatimonadota bacterium]